MQQLPGFSDGQLAQQYAMDDDAQELHLGLEEADVTTRIFVRTCFVENGTVPLAAEVLAAKRVLEEVRCWPADLRKLRLVSKLGEVRWFTFVLPSMRDGRRFVVSAMAKPEVKAFILLVDRYDLDDPAYVWTVHGSCVNTYIKISHPGRLAHYGIEYLHHPQ